jgi:hypothetical protein
LAFSLLGSILFSLDLPHRFLPYAASSALAMDLGNREFQLPGELQA